MRTPVAMRVGVLLALMLLLSACGKRERRDPGHSGERASSPSAPTASTPTVPAWAQIAPEQIAEANRIGIPMSEDPLHYHLGVVLGKGPGSVVRSADLDLWLFPSGLAELRISTDPFSDQMKAWGDWRFDSQRLVLDMRKEGGAYFIAYVTPWFGKSNEIGLHAERDCHQIFFWPSGPPDHVVDGCESMYHLSLVADLPEPGEGAR